MRIFVTGAESFIGKVLLEHCDAQGIGIVGVDLIESGRRDCSVGDITSPDIADLIPEGIEAVVHLAAVSRDGDCREHVYDCFQANVMGTMNLVRASRAKSVKQFIFASTEWVYGHFGEGEVKTEESVIDVATVGSEYALSKLFCEAIQRMEHENGFCPVTVLRFGIVYGPRSENWSAVESVFNAVATKEEVVVGSLKTGRHFIHVRDIASAIVKSVGSKGYEIFNIQGDALVTLGDVVEIGRKVSGKDPQIVESSPDSSSIRRVSNKKARDHLQWHPEVDLETGLRSVMEFLKL